jgi:hypothetical protein
MCLQLHEMRAGQRRGACEVPRGQARGRLVVLVVPASTAGPSIRRQCRCRRRRCMCAAASDSRSHQCHPMAAAQASAAAPHSRLGSAPGLDRNVQQTACNARHATCNRRHATDGMQQTACNVQQTACNVQQTACNVQQTACNVQQTACNVRQTACNVQQTACNRQHATHNMQRATDSMECAGGASGLCRTATRSFRIGSAEKCSGMLCSPAALLPLTRPTLIVVGEADKVRQSPYNGHLSPYNGHLYRYNGHSCPYNGHSYRHKGHSYPSVRCSSDSSSQSRSGWAAILSRPVTAVTCDRPCGHGGAAATARPSCGGPKGLKPRASPLPLGLSHLAYPTWTIPLSLKPRASRLPLGLSGGRPFGPQ